MGVWIHFYRYHFFALGRALDVAVVARPPPIILIIILFFFFFTLVAGPRRSLSVKLSDTRVYAPRIRARLGTTAHFCELVVLYFFALRGALDVAVVARLPPIIIIMMSIDVNLSTTTSQKCAVVPKRARVLGS